MSEILDMQEQVQAEVDVAFGQIIDQLGAAELTPAQEKEVDNSPRMKVQGYMDDGHSEEVGITA